MRYHGITILSLVFFIGLYICETSCNKSPENAKKDGFPFEQYFWSLDYPDFKPDYKAILESNRAIAQSISLRENSPFDSSWTTQGPGNIGGRFNTLAQDPNDANVIYAGSTCGGVFKTMNGGQSWFPIFDSQAFMSIGHISINQSNPNTIYVGTGDPNISGKPFIGNGIYKSTNAGQSWSHIGLEAASIISRIRIHPKDTNLIYVSAMGLPFEKNIDRGVYKSTNGGQTWQQVLNINDSTGICDLVLNPKDKNILYASGWNRIRTNRKSLVSGPDAKVYKSVDGGQNWTSLSNGLPQEKLSRIGIDIYPENPDTIVSFFTDSTYKMKGVYTSFDGGNQWINITNDLDSDVVRNFGWFFGQIRINPFDPKEIYILGVDMYRTTNGGLTWNMCTPPWYQYAVHADKHDLVFINEDTMILATDGGLYKSVNGGTQWSDIESIPVTQFYHATYNPHDYNTYWGGAQDNGTSSGDAFNFNNWQRELGGDGFKTVFHPSNPNIIYAETQWGNIVELSTNNDITGSGTGINMGQERVNWDMPYIMSHFNSDILYLGTSQVYKNEGGHQNTYWQSISPDLTDGNIYGKSFHNISCLIESPFNPDQLFVGTSDGNVWRTLDGGQNWDLLSNNLPDRYVTSIFHSSQDSQRLYISYSGHKYNDPYPHIFRSDDQGNSWIDISSDLPQMPIRDVIAHPNNDQLLFIASQGGVYGSINAGQNWHRIGNNMPIIPVFDITIHKEKNQIIAGTHARSLMTYELGNLGIEPPAETPNIEVLKLKTFPSIVNQWLNIECQQEQIDVNIINMNGQIIEQRKINKGLNRLNLQSLSSGIYILGYYNKEKYFEEKILKN